MTGDSPAPVDTVIIGAGMAGLAAARSLVAEGLSVVVLDKARAVGGRMATRRFGGGRFDHGAQHFSVRSEAFDEVVSSWIASGVARIWFESESVTSPERGIEPRHAGVDGMRGIPEHWATGLDVHTERHVERIDLDAHARVIGEGWRIDAQSVIVTAPLPQSLQLLDHSGIRLPRATRAELDSVVYDATLAVLAVTEEDAGLGDGHAGFDDGPVAWIADNRHKGISPVPALTIHSSATFGRTNVDADVETWTSELIAAVEARLGVSVMTARPHRWRYAQPQTTREDGAVLAETAVPVVVAGEVFCGARVEGAFQSGRAAATLIADRLG